MLNDNQVRARFNAFLKNQNVHIDPALEDTLYQCFKAGLKNNLFYLSEEEYKTIEKWKKEEVYPKVVKEQGIDSNIPNRGAIGGDTTYSFTPTGLGVIKVIKCFHKELDITNYENW